MRSQAHEPGTDAMKICPDPIFVIGSPRSGTTALATALGKHSRLWSGAESDFLFHLFDGRHAEAAFAKARGRPTGGWLRQQGVEREEFLACLGLGLNALFTSRSGTKRWVEKTPLHTEIVDVLSLLFPGAYFIHLLREGPRVVHSMINFAGAAGVKDHMIDERFVGSWMSEFREACRTWRRYVDRAMSFCAQNPSRCLTVRNHDLVANTHDRFRDLFRFVDVPEEDEPADFFRTHRMNSSFLPEDRTFPIVSDIVSDPWSEWTVEQRLVFLEEAGEAQVRYGLATPEELRVSAGLPRDETVARVRAVVQSALPADARVLVVSKGDQELVTLNGHIGQHFPQTEGGTSVGPPADGIEAVDQLERLREQGAQYLLFPSSSFWWLEHYTGLREHLAPYERIWADDACIVYRLDPERWELVRALWAAQEAWR
jgi:sulfotransferase family protein